MASKKLLFAVAAIFLIGLAANVSAWYYAYPSYYGYGGYTTCCSTYYSYPTYYQPYYAPVVYQPYYYQPTYYYPTYYYPRVNFGFYYS